MPPLVQQIMGNIHVILYSWVASESSRDREEDCNICENSVIATAFFQMLLLFLSSTFTGPQVLCFCCSILFFKTVIKCLKILMEKEIFIVAISTEVQF